MEAAQDTTEVGNVDFDVVVVGDQGVTPNFVEEVIFFDDFFWGAHEFDHSAGFFGGEADVVEFFVGNIVAEVEVVKLLILDLGRAADDGVDAGDEFGCLEGLDEIVVSAEVKTADFVVNFGEGGKHDDGCADTFLAKVAEDFDTGDFGEHDVENDAVVDVFGGGVEARFAVSGDVYRDFLFFKIVLNCFS